MHAFKSAWVPFAKARGPSAIHLIPLIPGVQMREDEHFSRNVVACAIDVSNELSLPNYRLVEAVQQETAPLLAAPNITNGESSSSWRYNESPRISQ